MATGASKLTVMVRTTSAMVSRWAGRRIGMAGVVDHHVEGAQLVPDQQGQFGGVLGVLEVGDPCPRAR